MKIYNLVDREGDEHVTLNMRNFVTEKGLVEFIRAFGLCGSAYIGFNLQCKNKYITLGSCWSVKLRRVIYIYLVQFLMSFVCITGDI